MQIKCKPKTEKQMRKKKNNEMEDEISQLLSQPEPQPPQYQQQEFDFTAQNSSLENVVKECFLIFEGTSQYNKPYKVLVVKKKYAFDPALIALCERLGVTVLARNDF